MPGKSLFALALSSLLIASPPLMAEEAHQHGQAPAEVAPAPTAVAPDASATTIAGSAPAGVAVTATQQDMVSASEEDLAQSGGMAPAPRGRGMMGRGKMGHGEMAHGDSGMMGHGGGHGMHKKQQEVLNRLDLLEARLAKIEFLLERLIQR